MTRKHFQALADGLALTRPEQGPDESDAIFTVRFTQWVDDLHAVARACAASNPRFDRERFTLACSLDAPLFGDHASV